MSIFSLPKKTPHLFPQIYPHKKASTMPLPVKTKQKSLKTQWFINDARRHHLVKTFYFIQHSINII